MILETTGKQGPVGRFNVEGRRKRQYIPVSRLKISYFTLTHLHYTSWGSRSGIFGMYTRVSIIREKGRSTLRLLGSYLNLQYTTATVSKTVGPRDLSIHFILSGWVHKMVWSWKYVRFKRFWRCSLKTTQTRKWVTPGGD